MTVECFWLEPTDRVRVWLRRYRSADVCPRPRGRLAIHDARTPVGEVAVILDEEGYQLPLPADTYSEHDPRWPTDCGCGQPFTDDDRRQVFTRRIHRRVDTRDEMTLDDAPAGAMWDAWWMPTKGPDGRCLMVKCPDGFEWMIDGRASNCTLPDDREHRCWLRTGEPPRITVGKKATGQRSCSAGGGSIGTPGYHGFLRDGRFT